MTPLAASATPVSTYKDAILQLRGAFTGSGPCVEGHISVPSKSMKCSNYFWGSPHAIFLSSQSTMEHVAPTCIASPLVTLVAKISINLGLGCKTPADKVVIFAPEQISISTEHLSIDNIQLVVKPKFGFISCSKLTLVKFSGEDPDYFEVVKSWLINKSTEVEVVVKSLPE